LLFRTFSHSDTVYADICKGPEAFLGHWLATFVSLEARYNDLQRACFSRQNLVFSCETTHIPTMSFLVVANDMGWSLRCEKAILFRAAPLQASHRLCAAVLKVSVVYGDLTVL